MHELLRAFEAIASRQDYLWFLASLEWIGVAVVAWKLPEGTRLRAVKPPLLGFALANLAITIIELGLGTTSSRAGATGFRPLADTSLVVMSGAGAMALAFATAPRSPRPARIIWQTAASLVLIVAVAWRCWAPVAARVWYQGNLFERGDGPFLAASGLAVVCCIIAAVAVVHWRRSGWVGKAPAEIRPWAQVAAGLIALQALVCTFGPIAEKSGLARRWGNAALSPLGVPSACIHIALAGTLLLIWWRWIGAPAVQPSPGWADEHRRLRQLLVIWLCVGALLAEWAAIAARRRFEASLLAQSRFAARLFDPMMLEKCLGPDLQLGRAVPLRQAAGQRFTAFEVDYARDPMFDGPRALLETIAADLPGTYPSIVTIRGESMVRAIIPRQSGLRSNIVSVFPLEAADQADWREKQSRVARSFDGSGRMALIARAPLLSGGKMLGWLELRLPASNWTASQSQARLLTFAIVALGVILGLVLALQRWHALRHEEARQLAAQSAAAERAKTDFIAKVSHELRTPAQGIIGYTQLLDSSMLAGNQREWLGALRGQTEILVRLVGDLLDLSAVQSGTFRLINKPQSLRTLVHDAAAVFQPMAARKKLAFHCSIDDDLPSAVLCDGKRVSQVLLNLISNAVKFTSRGRIEISAHCLRNLAATPGMVWCEVSVSDTGVGIRPEDQPRLFQPFTRLRDADEIEGNGLGLSLTAALVRAMGGSLEVESDGTSGTIFRVRWLLPLAQSEPDSTPLPARPSLENKCILVVDDSPAIRELLANYLGSLGAKVVAASDSESAVVADGAFDAIVMDISLPDRDGFETARDLRNRHRDPRALRIIALSAHAQTEIAAKARLAGIDTCLSKPADLQTIAAAILGDSVVDPAAVSPSLPTSLHARLAQEFAKEFPAKFLEMQTAVAEFDWPCVQRTAHYIRGVSAMLDLGPLRDACGELERKVEAGARESVPALCHHIHSLGNDYVRLITNHHDSLKIS